MNDSRLYAKIMQHLEDLTGTGCWDFRTLNESHPQLCMELVRIIQDCHGIDQHDKENITKRSVPRRLWDYAGKHNWRVNKANELRSV